MAFPFQPGDVKSRLDITAAPQYTGSSGLRPVPPSSAAFIPSKRNSPLALLSYINDALAPRTPLLRVCTRPAVQQLLALDICSCWVNAGRVKSCQVQNNLQQQTTVSSSAELPGDFSASPTMRISLVAELGEFQSTS